MKPKTEIITLLTNFRTGVTTSRDTFDDFPKSEANRQIACLNDAIKCVRSYRLRTRRPKR